MRRNAVLISIRPKWVEKIASGEKTVEVRKTRPSIETPFKCYIYCTNDRKEVLCVANGGLAKKGDLYLNANIHYPYTDGNLNGKVVGEFVCDWVYKTIMFDEQANMYLWGNDFVARETCLYASEMNNYGKGKPVYGWNISNLKIYDEPKALGGFRKPCIMPDEPYCPCCKHGRVTYSDDEIEYALYHGGYCDTCEWICNNRVTRPPQSWCYIEGVEA